MRILIVAPPSLPANPGAAEKDIYTSVKILKSMGHEVSFCTITYSKTQAAYANERIDLPKENVFVFRRKNKEWMKWLYTLFFVDFGYFDGAAFVFNQLMADQSFKNWVAQQKPDWVIGFCCYSWPIIRFAKKNRLKTIFRSHNYEPNFYYESLSWVQALYPTNWLRYGAKVRGERLAVRHADAVASLLFPDIHKYDTWKPKHIYRLPLLFTGENLRTPWVHSGKKPLDVFFLGANYKVEIHLRGVTELIEQIIPEVRKKSSTMFRFHICGANLPEHLEKQCNNTDVLYEGYVPEEQFEAFMNSMDIGLFPVKTGKTVKGKVADSLCRAFPLIIPDNSRGGYELHDGQEVLLAENVHDAVQALFSLENEDRRRALSEGAYAFAKREFSSETTEHVLRSIFSQSRS